MIEAAGGRITGGDFRTTVIAIPLPIIAVNLGRRTVSRLRRTQGSSYHRARERNFLPVATGRQHRRHQGFDSGVTARNTDERGETATSMPGLAA